MTPLMSHLPEFDFKRDAMTSYRSFVSRLTTFLGLFLLAAEIASRRGGARTLCGGFAGFAAALSCR